MTDEPNWTEKYLDEGGKNIVHLNSIFRTIREWITEIEGAAIECMTRIFSNLFQAVLTDVEDYTDQTKVTMQMDITRYKNLFVKNYLSPNPNIGKFEGVLLLYFDFNMQTAYETAISRYIAEEAVNPYYGKGLKIITSLPEVCPISLTELLNSDNMQLEFLVLKAGRKYAVDN